MLPPTKKPQKSNMVSLEKIQTLPKSPEHNSSPRISFSADFLDDKNFISISPARAEHGNDKDYKEKSRTGDFEFLSTNNSSNQTMITADELFFEGKMLPYWQSQHIEKLGKLNLKEKDTESIENKVFGSNKHDDDTTTNITSINSNRVNWFIDDDPSPRPPKCTVLWKELLRLKKQRSASSLSSSLTPSSSSSSSSSSNSFGEILPPIEEGTKEGSGKKEKHVKRIRKGLERTRSASIRIRPMVNLPVCPQGKSNGSLAPLFSLRKGRLER